VSLFGEKGTRSAQILHFDLTEVKRQIFDEKNCF
jgi:hypothetical protein